MQKYGLSHAKVLAVTQPVEDSDIPNDLMQLIAYCARVSNPANQHNTETAEKLIGYLIKHKHWSPFEMADILMEIRCPRDIARQILRHRSFSFQEFSQRYAEAEDFVIREARLQHPKNRQKSIQLPYDDPRLDQWAEVQNKILEAATMAYDWALKNGLAKECARVVLPEGLTVSTLYMKGSVRSWIHYLEVRMDEGAQNEHYDVAFAIAHAIARIFPFINNQAPKSA